MEPHQIEIETPRLKLVAPQTNMAQPMLDFVTKNKSFFEPWIPTTTDSYFTLGFQLEKLENDLAEVKEKRCVRLLVFEKEDTENETLVGDIAFGNIVWGPFLSCFVGYKFDEAHTGKGYATEALQHAIDFVFNELELHRIEANIIPRNKASIAVVERLNFENEGLGKKYLKINGVWEDHFHFVLRNSDLEN
jgi:ribosomal-protein-alanine N-acetyltransferase